MIFSNSSGYDLKCSFLFFRSSQYHYDDPRRELEREESYSRRLQQTQIAEPASQTRTMADRYESHVSPLEGAKVVVRTKDGL